MKRFDLLQALLLAAKINGNVISYQTANWISVASPCMVLGESTTSTGGEMVKYLIGGAVDSFEAEELDKEDYKYKFTVQFSSSFTSCRHAHAHSWKVERNSENDPTNLSTYAS